MHLRAPVEAPAVAAREHHPHVPVGRVHGRAALAVRRIAAVADDVVRRCRRELCACNSRCQLLTAVVPPEARYVSMAFVPTAIQWMCATDSSGAALVLGVKRMLREAIYSAQPLQGRA